MTRFPTPLRLFNLFDRLVETRVGAVARQTVEEGIRMRISLVFLLLLGLAVLGLPFAVEGDDTLTGRVQNFLSFSLTATGPILGILTIFLCRTLSNELVQRQVFVTLTKPIHRWEFMLGKWLGITVFNATFLAFVGICLYGMVYVMIWRYGPREMAVDASAREIVHQQSAEADLKHLHKEVLVARHSIKMEVPDFDRVARNLFERNLEEGVYESRVDFKADSELDELRRRAEAQWRTVGPLSQRVFEFKNVLCDRSRGEFVQLRYKAEVSNYTSDEVFRSMWMAGDPRKGTRVVKIPRRDLVGRFHSIPIPVECVASDNTLRVQFLNANPYGPTHYNIITFRADDEVEVLFAVGSFEGNLFRLLVMMQCKLMYLGALGLLATSVLSFPVACLTAFTFYGLAAIRGFVWKALDWATYNATSMFESFSSFQNMLSMGIVFVIGIFVPNFSYYDGVETLVNGNNVSLDWMLQTVLYVGILHTFLTLGLAMLLFHFREAAEVSL